MAIMPEYFFKKRFDLQLQDYSFLLYILYLGNNTEKYWIIIQLRYYYQQYLVVHL